MVATAEDWTDAGVVYGNVILKTDQEILEVVNDYFYQEIMNEESELVRLDIRKLKTVEEDNAPVSEEYLRTMTINSELKKIDIVRDAVQIFDSDQKLCHLLKIDRAFIFGFAEGQMLIGKNDSITLATTLVFGQNVEKFIASTERVASDWSDEENGKYFAKVARKV